MKYFLIATLILSIQTMAQQPSQIVINVDRQDFKPLQEVSWRLMAGSSSFSKQDNSISRTGTGLGIAIEKILTERWSLGAHYSNIRALTSDTSIYLYDQEGNRAGNREYNENVNLLNAYGKFAFINYPVNKWNLIQANLIGGIMTIDRGAKQVDLIYGIAASYNYDNLIGFELSTKVNFEAETSTSANLIGYF